MKKLLKFLGLGLLVLLLGLVIAGFAAHESLPTQIQTGAAADDLARKIEQAVNKDAWDETRFVAWEFISGTKYLWDKEKKAVQVSWGDYRVLLNTPTGTGVAYENDKLVENAEESQKLLDKAWSQFANDSFWLCAPMKLFDPGTRRSIAKNKDGEEGLLVQYTSGGVTPGDSYLWLLEDNGRPRAWQMWTSIIPVGGLVFTWENWAGNPNQPQIAQQHSGKLLDVPISNLNFPTYQDSDNPLKALWE
jgi:hypothetical protein